MTTAMNGKSYLRVAALTLALAHAEQRCTTIALGKGATTDGSTIVTHNADCKNCDFRLARTPARDHAPGTMTPILRYRGEYPRYVTNARGATWRPENLDGEIEHTTEWAGDQWQEDHIVGYFPQANHTYALYEAMFGIMNEKQVSIGEVRPASDSDPEYRSHPRPPLAASLLNAIAARVRLESTCVGALGQNALPRACATCDGPLFDISALSFIALERCDSAVCAVDLIGALAEEHGRVDRVVHALSILLARPAQRWRRRRNARR